MLPPGNRKLPDGRHLHVLTPEYPPQIGGVSDYVTRACNELSALGQPVTIWCPALPQIARQSQPGQCVQELADGYELAGILDLERRLNTEPAPRRLLLQWVPHGFGYLSLNVLLCVWLWWRSLKGDAVEIVLHEPFLRFGERGLKQDLAALIHRLMTIILLQATRIVWMVTPEWEPLWRPYALGRQVDFRWMPLSMSAPADIEPGARDAVRARLGIGDSVLIGHFGTFNHEFSVVLKELIPDLMRDKPGWKMLLIGKRSTEFLAELLQTAPELDGRVLASGLLSTEDLTRYMLACDVMAQPYPDGVNARRTSLLVCMMHRMATVATTGAATEPFWQKCSGVKLTSAGNRAAYIRAVEELAADSVARTELGRQAWEFSNRLFAPGVGTRIFLGLDEPAEGHLR